MRIHSIELSDGFRRRRCRGLLNSQFSKTKRRFLYALMHFQGPLVVAGLTNFISRVQGFQNKIMKIMVHVAPTGNDCFFHFLNLFT